MSFIKKRGLRQQSIHSGLKTLIGGSREARTTIVSEGGSGTKEFPVFGKWMEYL